MNLVPAINQIESEIKRYKNMKDEKYRELRSAYYTFSRYCKPCDCNVENKPDFILENIFEEKKVHCICCQDLGYLSIAGEVNVIPAMKVIIEEIKANDKKCKEEVHELEEGLKIIRDLNTTCERCMGSGKVYKPRANSYCERELAICPNCNGTGKIKKKV